MSADLEYLASLNDQQFQATIKRLDQTIATEQAKMDSKAQRGIAAVGSSPWRTIERGARAGAIAMATSLAVSERAMRSFAESFGPAASQLDRMRESARGVSYEIGSSLMYSGAIERAVGVLEWMADAWRSVADGVSLYKTALSDGTPGATPVSTWKAAVEQLEKYQAERAEVAREDFKLRARSELEALARENDRRALSAKGDQSGLARLEAQDLERRTRERIDAITKQAVRAGLGTNDIQALAADAMEASDRAQRTILRRVGHKFDVGNIEQGQGLKLFSAVFGGNNARFDNASTDIPKLQLDAQRQTNETLRRIEQKTRGARYQ